MIYLDNAATTKPVSIFIKQANYILDDKWFNPSAVYKDAIDIKKDIDDARRMAEHAMDGNFRCYFTSGGTEGAFLALFGAIDGKPEGKHILTTKVEHPCVYENIKKMQEMGAIVEYVKTDKFGVIDQQDFVSKLTDETALISIMHVNNITGGINDITKLYELSKKSAPKSTFHSDGVQGFIKVSPPKCDLYTASGHKINALKGIGMLFVRDGFKFKGKMLGGGQQDGVRSGTENTFGIISLQYALEFWRGKSHVEHMRTCKQNMLELINEKIENVVINSPDDGAPHILNLSILGVGGEIMLHSLESYRILISTGSACSSRKKDNRISLGLEMSKDQADSQIRISFSHDTKFKDIETVVDKIAEIAEFNRRLMRSKN